MSCELERDRLSGYLDGELDERERGEVERHIAACSDCLRELSEVKAAVAQLRQLPRMSPPARMRQEMARRVAISGVQDRRIRWMQGMVAAAAVVLFAISVFVIVRQERVVPSVPIAHRDAPREGKAPTGELSTLPPAPAGKARGVEEDRKQRAGFVDLPLADEAAPATATEPLVFRVEAVDVAAARVEVEGLFKKLGVAMVEGAEEFGRDVAVKAEYVCVEVTSGELEELEKHLKGHQAQMRVTTVEEERKVRAGEPMDLTRGRTTGSERSEDADQGRKKFGVTEAPKGDAPDAKGAGEANGVRAKENVQDAIETEKKEEGKQKQPRRRIILRFVQQK